MGFLDTDLNSSFFHILFQKISSNCIDLDHAAKLLQVPKGLIEDVTNVLDGIGLIEKQSKSIIVWKGVEAAAANIEKYINGPALELDGAEIAAIVEDLKEKLTELYEEDSMLDSWIKALESFPDESMTDLYCTKADILNALSKQRGEGLCNRVMEDKICSIVARAPVGTMLEVPYKNDVLQNRDNDLRMSTSVLESNLSVDQTSSSPLNKGIDVHYISSNYNSSSKSYQTREGPIPMELDCLTKLNKHEYIDYATSSICIKIGQNELLDLSPTLVKDQTIKSLTDFY